MHKYITAVVLLAAPLASVHAAPVAPGSARVRVSASDLSSPAAVAALRLKIRAAVKEVCAREPVASGALTLAGADCVSATQADADRQLDQRLRSGTMALASAVTASR